MRYIRRSGKRVSELAKARAKSREQRQNADVRNRRQNGTKKSEESDR
jgi:hypothetical protein